MPKQKLYLTSNGLEKSHVDDFLKFYDQNPQGHKVAFIPTATNKDEDSSWTEIIRQQLRDLGFIIEDVDLEKVHHQDLERILKTKDVIFLNGGNTYYLLYWIKKSGFDKIIPDLLNQGKIYIGLSAGSIVAGPNISLAGWKPDEDINGIQLADLTGLNLVNFAISPHYNPTDPRHIARIPQQKVNFPHKVIALTDDQAIAVTGDEYKIVGPGEQLIYD